ncbi:DUF6777 domain-containing protein [Mycolicibacterium litorale]|uniref:DUF6777 domain-containing protein n=1 Tax=Mycolicibacterium litorale TaxID=758802 RepID=UPI0039A3EA19
MTDPHSGWIDPNPPDAVDAKTPVVLAVSAIVLTAVVVATLIGVVLRATDDEAGETVGVVALLPANVPADGSFGRSVVTVPVVISHQAASAAADLFAQLPVRADRGVRLVSGRQRGIYGATGETPSCDVVTLANDLDADPALARIWGLALGLTPQQIPYYLNSLTAVVLLADTWVTTHALRDGAAHAEQAVLQAGNSILVDPVGVPRVHCASAAPLVPPAPGSLARYGVHGDRWPGFAAARVVAVDYAGIDAAPGAGDFTVVDIDTGQEITTKSGGAIDLRGASVPLPDPAVMNIPPDHAESGDR